MVNIEYPKIEVTTRTFIDSEHPYPVYLCYEEDGIEFEFTKIEKYRKTVIKKGLISTTVEVFHSKAARVLCQCDEHNLSDEKTFNKAFKEFLKSVK